MLMQMRNAVLCKHKLTATAIRACVSLCGFRFVPSGPLVRSSYKAGEYFIENMIKSDREKVRARRGEGGLHSLAEDRARL